MNACRPIPVSTIDWDYAYLIDLRAQGDSATLVCGSEADSPEFEVVCTALDALAPFAELHTAWRQTPAAVAPPLIPYTRERSGRRTFCTRGATHDYPFLDSGDSPNLSEIG